MAGSMTGSTSSIGQFNSDQFSVASNNWNASQYGNMTRKTNADLSPGGGRRKLMNIIGMESNKSLNSIKNKGFFGEDEDTEPSMYFNMSSNSQSLFRPDKEMMTSPSPSQLSGVNANFYGQPAGMGSISIQQRNVNNSQVPRNITPTSGIGTFPFSVQQSSPNRSMFSSSIGNQRGSTVGAFQRKASQSVGSHLSLTSSTYSRVNMVSKSQSEQPEFTIQQEDFPALPGSSNPQPPIQDSLGKVLSGPGGASTFENAFSSKESNKLFPGMENKSSSNSTSSTNSSTQKKIQTHPDGTVSNIPQGMVTDQFGMVGLLTFIRAAETDPNLVALAPGIDLTTLGLNLNSPESLYSTFQSPWADAPCRPQDIDFHVPSEYLTNIFIRDKLAPIKLNRYGEDLLFYLFYMNGGDVLQLAAAAELYNRDWRYHKEERVWITRAPGMDPIVKTNSYERGTYYFFDVQNWRKVAKEFHLEYDKLEERPHLPATLQHNQSQPIMAH
ncbi:CCR4-NOT transcription complex subunit 2-like isoform X2 [Tubulanus polymorphus]|uniref:CCR4-NOT transcription complex subunit 2-like isoform X2 n=1 Tax=Tubulanus polymorphus TaxID=672921 RepID=UPI003DA4B7E7